MADLSMPKLGVTMTEGVLVQWLAGDGEQVTEGQLIYVIGTDKVDSEIPAPAAGILRRIAAEDQTYQVGELLGQIEQPG
jgi:pyruvate/2-oxoglutarate dehydrogenase complex dihydrolipoamide acyltransferase (E2) component